MPELHMRPRRRFRAALAALVLGASAAAAQTPISAPPTRSELAQRLLSPAERSAPDDAPEKARAAPSFGLL